MSESSTGCVRVRGAVRFPARDRKASFQIVHTEPPWTHGDGDIIVPIVLPPSIVCVFRG